MSSNRKLKVLYVSAEISPFARTGGLAEVAASLPGFIASYGNDVRAVMPGYKQIETDMEYRADFPVILGGKSETCIVREGSMNFKEKDLPGSIPVYFICNYNYFDRDGIYCFNDDGERFAFFCEAVLKMLPEIGFKPDIIHCNDWHTGPVCMLLKEKYAQSMFFKDTAAVFTIHNLQYQGNFHGGMFDLFDLSRELFTSEKSEFYGAFSFMKCGIAYADKINTVSRNYALEIQTPEYGEGMEGILKKRVKDLSGIINGISYEEYNPQKDTDLIKNFDAGSIEAKKDNKHALQKELGLPIADVPVIGIVSRLSGQKGLDLVLERIREFLAGEIQFVLLGVGEHYYEGAFKKLKKELPEKVGIHIGFDAQLAKRVYAGSDIFLMPSRFEPCGLGQIISLRYGTIPVVRETGGLAETVTDYSKHKKGNGFTFADFNSDSFEDALKRALAVYSNRNEWTRLVKLAMACDFSWGRSAEKYIGLYETALVKDI
ncbi:MAG: glycogen synthase [Eubacteriales bacterium]|nr:glycogen synthase [Eubacteriales bacterium]